MKKLKSKNLFWRLWENIVIKTRGTIITIPENPTKNQVVQAITSYLFACECEKKCTLLWKGKVKVGLFDDEVCNAIDRLEDFAKEKKVKIDYTRKYIYNGNKKAKSKKN